MTLVETLMVMLLLAIVSTLVTRAVLDSHKVVRLVTDQSDGLADVRIASERLGRDIREARSVVCNPAGTPAAVAAADPTCKSHLQMWIDYDSNYVQTADETVTWRLAPGTKPGQFDLVRAVGGVTFVVEARTIVTNIAANPASSAPHVRKEPVRVISPGITARTPTNTP